MRPYRFELKGNEEIFWESFIHWMDVKGENHLVGRVCLITDDVLSQRYIIEYFNDCLAELLSMECSFKRIPGCDHTLGKRVWEYPQDYKPIFIEERTLNPKREDTRYILNHYGLECNMPFEYFDRSGGVCSDNSFFLFSKEDASEFYHHFLHGIRAKKPNDKGYKIY